MRIRYLSRAGYLLSVALVLGGFLTRTLHGFTEKVMAESHFAAHTLKSVGKAAPAAATLPPHCSKAILTYSHSSRLTRRSLPLLATSQASLDIGVGQSICFRVLPIPPEETKTDPVAGSLKPKADSATTPPWAKGEQPAGPAIRRRKRAARNFRSSNSGGTIAEGSQLLHTLTLSGLELYHPITERYKFAIPEVETSCICECNANSPTCQADEYKYGKCWRDDYGAYVADSSSPRVASARFARSSEGRPTACYRTFFANQAAESCGKEGRDGKSGGSSARLCCQLRFRASAGRSFTAFRLGASTTSAVLLYRTYAWGNGTSSKQEGVSPSLHLKNIPTTVADTNSTQLNGSNTQLFAQFSSHTSEWRELDRRRIRVQLDGSLHNALLDERSGLKLALLGLGGKSNSLSQQLEQGMYYAENLPNGQLDEIRSQPLNRANEHDFHKLGWFRISDQGEPFVQSGDIFLDKIHHARVDNCAEQRYHSVLEASYYTNKENNASSSFHLAEPLWRTQRWIRSAYVYDKSERQAVVLASEGSSLEMTIMVSAGDRQITFVHNSSQLGDFNASILVDRFSNSLLNLSLLDAKGVLNGHVRQLEDWSGEDVDSFSVTVPPANPSPPGCTGGATPVPACPPRISSVVIPIKPYPLNSIQLVCLRPEDSPYAEELCQAVHTVQYELEVNTIRSDWTPGKGVCDDCNHISVDGFMKFLNPANWSKGINSLSDALMLASDIFGYLFVLIVLYIVVFKIVWPLLSCCLCPMSTMLFYSRSKKP